MHTPEEQTFAVVPVPVTHTVPHPPQFEASVFVFFSHPSAALPLQSIVPAAQPVHDPLEHVWLVVQDVVVQVVPQLVSELIVFSQPFDAVMSQSISPVPQAMQEPAEHVWLLVQAVVFVQVVPQLRSELVSFSQPFAALVSQSSDPAEQAVHAPVVVLHVWLVVQAVFEQPQLASVFVFSQVLLPSQFRVPAVQVGCVHAGDPDVPLQ